MASRLRGYLSRTALVRELAIGPDTLATMIREGKFPPPDKVIPGGRGECHYWQLWTIRKWQWQRKQQAEPPMPAVEIGPGDEQREVS